VSHTMGSLFWGGRVTSDRREKVFESALSAIPLRFRTFLLALLVAISYYAGTKLGFSFTPAQTPISTFWPPNAILLAVLLLVPTRLWWAFLLAVLPAHLLVQLQSGVPMPSALGWFAGNTGEALLGAVAIRYFKKEKLLFDSLRDIAIFLVFGVLVAPLVTSFLDAAVVVLTGLGRDYWVFWTTRLSSNMISNLTIVPTAVLLATCWSSWIRTGTLARWVEAGLLAFGTVFFSVLVFSRPMTNSILGLIYAPLALLLLAAVRFGVAGLSFSTLVVAVVSIWNTMHNVGPLVRTSIAESVLSLHVLIGAFALPLMFLAAAIAERRHGEEWLRSIREKLIRAQEQERHRIARELHDDIVQRLTLAGLELDRVRLESDAVLRRELDRLHEQVSSASEATRALSHDLHPFVLEYLGLEKGLRTLCRNTGEHYPVSINFTGQNVPPDVAYPISLCLYRVAQEALQNIVKHSQARVATIELKATSGQALLRILDDGIGMSPEQQHGAGMGLASMRERVTALGGTLKISSAPSKGTTIDVSIPFAEGQSRGNTMFERDVAS
jgi:signal transduction histidine kinase